MEGLRWGLRLCIPHAFPGDTGTAGRGPHAENHYPGHSLSVFKGAAKQSPGRARRAGILTGICQHSPWSVEAEHRRPFSRMCCFRGNVGMTPHVRGSCMWWAVSFLVDVTQVMRDGIRARVCDCLSPLLSNNSETSEGTGRRCEGDGLGWVNFDFKKSNNPGQQSYVKPACSAHAALSELEKGLCFAMGYGLSPACWSGGGGARQQG